MKTNTIIRFSAGAVALCALSLLLSQGVAGEKKSMVPSSEEKFIKEAAAKGMAEVKLADLGVKKAERTDVREFAERLAKDHTSINDQLKQLASQKAVELSTVIAPAHARTYQKLEKYSGGQFDREFLEQMESSHKKAVDDFENAGKDAQDRDLKGFIDQTLPSLQVHHAKAKELKAK